MSLINLLPHRAAAKKLRQAIFNRHLGYCALMGLLLALALHLYFQVQLSGQLKKNQIILSQSAQLDTKIKEGQVQQQAVQALRVRQQAVNDLQAERNIPVYLMTELIKKMPEGVYITSLRMDKEKVSLQGVAPSSEKVADFLQNMGTDSTWFTRPELLEVLAGSANLGVKASRNASSFSMLIYFRRATASALGHPLASEIK